MSFTPLLQRLLTALCCLPGVGRKTAQRMALHLLEKDRDGGQTLVQALSDALDGIGLCEQCRMFAEDSTCPICAGSRRNRSILCVVETPADVIAVEDSASYSGVYFVLLGRLSPLDGIGPEELGIETLERRLSSGEIKELILATSATVEGEATASFLAGLAGNHNVKVTRIAHGVPVGGELEYVDSGTLSRAIGSRTLFDS